MVNWYPPCLYHVFVGDRYGTGINIIKDSFQDLGTHRAFGHSDLGSQVPAQKVPRRRYSFERYSNSNVRIWIIKILLLENSNVTLFPGCK